MSPGAHEGPPDNETDQTAQVLLVVEELGEALVNLRRVAEHIESMYREEPHHAQ